MQNAAESVKKKLTNKVTFLAKSTTLSNHEITPPRNQVEELQKTPRIAKISKTPAKWNRKVKNRTAQKVARKAGRSTGKCKAWQEAHAVNVCNQVKNWK